MQPQWGFAHVEEQSLVNLVHENEVSNSHKHHSIQLFLLVSWKLPIIILVYPPVDQLKGVHLVAK